MNTVTPQMPSNLIDFLKKGAPALLLTAGSDGYPSSAYTWAVAVDDKRVRFAVGPQGTAAKNLAGSGLAGLHIIGAGNLAFLIKGKSVKVRDAIDAVKPNELTLWEMEVIGARDQSYAGVIAKPFIYVDSSGDRDGMAAVESAVFAEMKR